MPLVKLNLPALADKGGLLSVDALEDSSRLEPPFKFAGRLGPKILHIGAFSYVRGGVFSNVEFGRYNSVAEGVYVGSMDHPTDWLSTSPFQFTQNTPFAKTEGRPTLRFKKHKPTVIGSDVWIANKTMILGGLNIGHGAIIAAGAVVTSDVPPYAIVGGVPARIIRYRFNDAFIERLLRVQWWKYDYRQFGKITFDNPEKALDEIEALGLTPYAPGFLPLI